jgi:hypothetical protein
LREFTVVDFKGKERHVHVTDGATCDHVENRLYMVQAAEGTPQHVRGVMLVREDMLRARSKMMGNGEDTMRVCAKCGANESWAALAEGDEGRVWRCISNRECSLRCDLRTVRAERDLLEAERDDARGIVDKCVGALRTAMPNLSTRGAHETPHDLTRAFYLLKTELEHVARLSMTLEQWRHGHYGDSSSPISTIEWRVGCKLCGGVWTGHDRQGESTLPVEHPEGPRQCSCPLRGVGLPWSHDRAMGEHVNYCVDCHSDVAAVDVATHKCLMANPHTETRDESESLDRIVAALEASVQHTQEVSRRLREATERRKRIALK